MELAVKRESLISSHQANIRNHYRFTLSTLGEGSYGFVRAANQIGSGIPRAIKVIPKSRIKNKETLEREISIMKQMDHPNIVKLYETYDDIKYLYLVMELCQGGELFDKIIELGHFSEKVAAKLLSQMLASISFLHGHGIAHRDLKPENFLFLENDIYSPLKLIDFGLAKTVDKVTKLTTKTGTCYYVSPEVLNGSYTEKCDIWSLGVILFMMLSGYPPFDGESDTEILAQVRVGELKFDDPVWEKISESAKDLLNKMLHKDPEQRISATECLEHSWLSQYETCNTEIIKPDVESMKAYQKSTHLRKTVLNYMATQCSTSDLADQIALFQQIDTNKDGKLSLDEMNQVLEGLDDMNAQQLQQLFFDIDTDMSGSIDLTEFLAAMLERKVYLNEQMLLNAFKRFDLDDSGLISAGELQEVLDQDKSVQDIDFWSQLIREVDEDGDGYISYQDFVKMMEKSSETSVESLRKSLNSEDIS